MARKGEFSASIEALMGEYREMRKSLEQMQQELLQVQATAYYEDGLVIATVGPRGHLIGLHIDPYAHQHLTTTEISQAILRTAQEAAGVAAAEVAEITQRYTPERFGSVDMQGFDFSDLLDPTDARLGKDV